MIDAISAGENLPFKTCPDAHERNNGVRDEAPVGSVMVPRNEVLDCPNAAAGSVRIVKRNAQQI